MAGKRVWRSAVARILSKKWDGLSAPEVAALLARELRHAQREKRLNLAKVCTTVGITVDYKYLDVDAILHETESGYLAILNAATSKSRQRFSLAHELGHVMLHQATGLRQAFGHLSSAKRQSAEGSEIEDLCDAFAAELLMPLESWQERILDDGISLKVIKKLISQYGVSMPAAARRIIEASSWKCLIISWEPIYINDVLVELKGVGCWESISRGKQAWPESIPNNPEFCVPGSPLYAIETKRETTGTLRFPFTPTGLRYIAQSDLFITQRTHRVATILIPESYGWPIILKSRNNGLVFRPNDQQQLSLLGTCN